MGLQRTVWGDGAEVASARDEPPRIYPTSSAHWAQWHPPK